MEYKFTEANFNNEVIDSDIPVLVDFYADWCGPCQMMMPIIEELAEEYDGRIKIGKVNTDEDPSLAVSYGVMSIPTFLFIKNGKVVNQAMGYTPKHAIEEKLNSLLSD